MDCPGGLKLDGNAVPQSQGQEEGGFRAGHGRGAGDVPGYFVPDPPQLSLFSAPNFSNTSPQGANPVGKWQAQSLSRLWEWKEWE